MSGTSVKNGGHVSPGAIIKHRISIIFLSLFWVLVALTGCGHRMPPPGEGGLSEPVTLFLATDLHYLSPELTDQGPYFRRLIQNGDGKVMDRAEEITDAFISQVIEKRPDALILSGDLTFNGAKVSHTALAEKLQRVREAEIPVFVLPGNHDLGNPMAASFSGDGYALVDSISPQEFEEIYRPFGYEGALSRDSFSLSYLAEAAPGLRLLMLDVNTPAAPGILTESTLRWAEKQLEEAQRAGAQVVAVSHQNLLQHNPLFSDGYVMEGSGKLLALYEEYDVLCNLSGHMHIQHTAQSAAGLPEMAASSLLVAPNQYGVLMLENGKAAYQAVPLPLEFAEYAREFLWDTSYRQAAAMLGDQPETERLARYFAEVNSAYIAGRTDAIQWDEALAQEWQRQGQFLSVYLESIREDVPRDHTKYDFDFSE